MLKVPTTISITGDSDAVVEVGTSNSTEYALLSDGTVWAWGLGAAGQLGNGTTTTNQTTPVKVDFPAGVTIARLATDAMPFNAALAIDTSGNVWGWGNNKTGALCQGGTTPQQYSTPVQIPLTDVTLVAGASGHSLFYSNGAVYACGLYQNGSLGDGKKSGSQNTPIAVVDLPTGMAVTALYASSVDSGALLANGAFYDWGANQEDQLGVGTGVTQSAVPVQVSLRAPVVDASEGGDNTGNGSVLVELSDGSYWSWGADAYGQLGNGGTTNQPLPIEFTPPAGVGYTQLAATGATGYGITAAGAVYAWGNGTQYELGRGTKTSSLSPIEVLTSGVTQVSATAQDIAVLG